MDELVEVLEREYGLPVAACEPGPRGWTGKTYVIGTLSGERVFVKVFPRAYMPPTVEPALAVLEQLGWPNISRPLRTRGGELRSWLGADTVVVYEYFDGVRVLGLASAEVGALIGRVHSATARGSIGQETFRRDFGHELWQLLEDAEDPRVRRLAAEQQPVLRTRWAKLEELGSRCRDAGLALVLTHGDWPFNVLQGAGGEIYLVDWDELLLAPRERDLWFPHAGEAFFSGYPRYEHNDLATAFYVYARYFEDVFWSARAVAMGTIPAQHTHTELFDNPWMNGLRERMASYDPVLW